MYSPRTSAHWKERQTKAFERHGASESAFMRNLSAKEVPDKHTHMVWGWARKERKTNYFYNVGKNVWEAVKK